MFATYHMTQPAVFYNREDQWDIPAIEQSGRNARRCSPTTPSCGCRVKRTRSSSRCCRSRRGNRENLAAWLVARSDGEHYGRLRVFEFPKQKTVYGPRQVVARINQDQTISPQITLWNQQGSQAIWGTLMVIPIEESLIYVRPLYLRAAGGSIPELTRVVVAHQDQIVMERTLDEALARLFGGEAARRRRRTSDRARRSPRSRPAARRRRRPGLTQLTAGGEARAHYDRAVEGAARRRLGQVRRGASPPREVLLENAIRFAAAPAWSPDGSRFPGSVSVLIHARSTSATVHACAMQPRGVNGCSASKISLSVPTPASSRCAAKPSRHCRAPPGRPGWIFSHASMNGPTSQPQTVPW